MDSIQLNPGQPQDQPKIDLGSTQGFDLPSSDTASARAAKASFGLGDILGKPYDDFYGSIVNGQELPLRQESAAKVDADKAKRKQGILTRAAQSGLTSGDLYGIAGVSTQTDPKSVIEEYHASKFLQPVWDNPGEDGQKAPKETADAINHTVSNLAYRNYALTRLQRAVDKYQNQSWFGATSTTDVPGVGAVPEQADSTLGWMGDQVKNISQIYQEIKLRGLSGDWNDFLGGSLDKERQDFYNMPFDEFKQSFDARMDQLEQDNPTLAIQYAAAVVGQSRDDIEQNDATTLLGLPSDLSVVGGAAERLASIRRIRGLVQSVAKAESTLDTVKTAEEVKETQARASGDLHGAAVNSAGQVLADKFEVRDNPVQQLVKTMPDLFNWDNVELNKNVGKAGQDIANRLIEQNTIRGFDFRNAMTELLRNNRVPVVIAGNDAAEAGIRAWVTDKYSGPNSQVIGVGKELLWDNPTATWHLSVEFGDHNGEYFTSEGQAVSHADTYGIELHEPPKTTRQYWDDLATASAFEVEDLKGQIKQYDKYGKSQFKPKEYYRIKRELDAANLRKKDAWAQRAGAYWQPNMPVPEKLGKTTLEKQGKGWYLQSWVPLDETQSAVRDNLIKIPGAWSGSSGGFWSGLVKGDYKERFGTETPYLVDLVTGTPSTRLLATTRVFIDSLGPLEAGIRMPDETLSPEENIQRKIATHVPGALADRLFGEDAKTIQKIAPKNVGDFKKLLIYQQNELDPVTGEHGNFYRNIGDLEDWYTKYTGRYPTTEELEGYFAYTRIYESERGLRILSMMRNKLRNGVQSHRIMINGKWTEPFDAIIQKGLPSAYEKNPVYVALKEMPDGVRLSGTWPKTIQEGVEQGRYNVLELWNREDMPFHSLSKSLTRNTKPVYVLTDNLRTTALDPNRQVPRRGGGHWVFPYDNYMRQAGVYYDPVAKQWIYEGDRTAMPFQNVGLGRKITSHFNEIKNLIAEGMVDDARDLVKYLGVGGLDFDKHILPKFVGKDAIFNLHEPFVLVPTDETIMGMNNELLDRYKDKGGLLDTTRYGNKARNNTVEFTGKRDAWDLHTIEDHGSARNPVYQYRPAQFADPIDVVSRGITRITNSTWLDDMKMFAAEHWYQTYKNQLEIKKGGTPMYHFLFPQWKEGVKTTDPVRSLAMSNRKKALDFIALRSPLQNWIHRGMTEAVGAIYNRAGPQAANMLRPILEVPFEKNKVMALQSLTSDLKIGLGSIPAFFMQMSAFTNISAFEPIYSDAAVRAALLHEYARWMPQHANYLDEIAQKMSLRALVGKSYWKPGHWYHLWEGLNTKTNFAQVGAEHAMANVALSDRYMKNNWDTVRYWGSTAFREAAQFVRIAAWYTSGLKWIEKNEGRLPMTTQHWSEIQSYATFLDHNMDRSSKSSINSGVMAVPMQFQNYARNLMEDMWGKRATGEQKARLFLYSSLFFGVPFGGLAMWGLPLGYQATKWAINNGYIVGHKAWQDIIMQGLPEQIVATITGGGDFQKGSHLDFSRFGVKGWDVLAGLFSDDARWWNLLGAMPTTAINFASRLHPLWQDIVAGMHGVSTSNPVTVPGVGSVPGQGGDWSKFNPGWEDILDQLKEWNTASKGIQLWKALRTGTWFSTNNTPLEQGVTAKEAVVRALTGMTSIDTANTQEMFGILGDRKSQYETTLRRASRNYNLAMQELKANLDIQNNPAYHTYMRKVVTDIQDIPVPDQHKIWNEIFKRNRTLFDALRAEMGTYMATPEDMDTYKEQLRLNQKREDNR